MASPSPVLLFPGQATEAVGMSGPWVGHPTWEATLAEAEEACGFPLRALMAEGPLESLKAQRVAPCAVLAHSVALYRAHRAEGMPLAAAATGHSMGFFSACVAAEVVSLPAALDLIRATEDLSEARFGTGTHGMAFVIGLKEPEVREALEHHPGLAFSNLNSGAQFTVSGPRASLEAFAAELAPRALKCEVLPVRLPLHCAHMAPLLPGVRERLEAHPFQDPFFPLISPLDGRAMDSGFECWEEAIVSIASAINWPYAVAGLKAAIPEATGEGDEVSPSPWMECGHGKQLATLTGWCDRGLRVQSLQDPRPW